MKHDFYLAYLNSAEWRMRRQRALKLAGYRCHRCGAKRPLQVHHKTYDRLGAEWDQDLEVLCVTCHEAATEADTPDQESKYFIFARMALRAAPFAGLGQLFEAVKLLCAANKISYDSGRITRAVELVTGKRLMQAPAAVARRPRSAALTDAQAHELFIRLELTAKAMPLAGISAADQEAHECKIQQQVAEAQQTAYRDDRRRRPIAERLAEIWSGE